MLLRTAPLLPPLYNPLSLAPLWRPTLALMAGIAVGLSLSDTTWGTVGGWVTAALVLLLLALVTACIGHQKAWSANKEGCQGAGHQSECLSAGMPRQSQSKSLGSSWCKLLTARLTPVLSYLAIAATGATLCLAAIGRICVVWPDGEKVYAAEVTSLDKFTDSGTSVNVRLLSIGTAVDGSSPRNAADVPSARQVAGVPSAHETTGAADESQGLEKDNAPRSAEISGKTVRLRLSGAAAQRLQPGDRLAFTARLTDGRRAGNPGGFDYGAYLLTQGISGTGYVDSLSWQRLTPAPHPTLRTRLLRLRRQLTATYAAHFSGETLAILSALTLGDKALLTPGTRAAFSDTGTSHVLALSGLHLSILFTLLQWAFLRWIRRRSLYLAANGLSLLALWGFVFLTGAPLSLLRAATMFSLIQVGLCLRRTVSTSLSNLAFAALLLLLCSPLALYDVGFQLSFSAVAGILLIGRYVWQRYPLPYTLLPGGPFAPPASRARRLVERFLYQPLRSIVWPFVTVSLSAQLATAPLIVYYFHSLPPYALVANAVVIPAAYVLLGGSLVFFLLPLAPVRALCAQVLSIVTEGMTNALVRMASWPGASFHLYPTTLTIVAVTACSVCLYLYCVVWNRRPRLLLLSAMVALLAAAGVSEAWRLRPDRLAPGLIVYSLPRTTAVQFVRSADCSRLYSSTTPDSARLRLSYIERTFFAPHAIAFPTSLTAPRCDEGWLQREGDYYRCLGRSLFVLRRSVPRHPPDRPMALDVLLVAKGCRDSLGMVLLTFRPAQIVLDRTLSYSRRRRWLTDAQRHGLPCHDLATDGAFILPARKP